MPQLDNFFGSTNILSVRFFPFYEVTVSSFTGRSTARLQLSPIHCRHQILLLEIVVKLLKLARAGDDDEALF